MTKKTIASFLALAAFLCSAATDAKVMSGNKDLRHGLPPGGDGPVYTGAPDLATTAALAQAGGGATTFSIAKALTAMVGPDVTKAEVNKLTKQYGQAAVTSWITVFDFAVDQASATASAAKITFPEPPADLQGKALAVQLVKEGAGNGTFWSGTMLDHLVSHKIHESTMDAIDAKYGQKADGNYHRITNQAMYDLAQALGAKDVMPAPFH